MVFILIHLVNDEAVCVDDFNAVLTEHRSVKASLVICNDAIGVTDDRRGKDMSVIHIGKSQTWLNGRDAIS